MRYADNLISLPIPKRRGRKPGSKNRPKGDVAAALIPAMPAEVHLLDSGIDDVKHYCFDVMAKARAKGKSCENSLVGLLHWFRVNHID